MDRPNREEIGGDLGMKTLLPRLGALTMGAILLTSAYYRTNSASLMTETANRFLAALTPEQRAKATFPLDDPERVKWFYVPIERKGLPLREMSPYQRSEEHTSELQ